MFQVTKPLHEIFGPNISLFSEEAAHHEQSAVTSQKRFIEHDKPKDGKENILLFIKKRCEAEISFCSEKYSQEDENSVEDLNKEISLQQWKTFLVAAHQNFLVSAVSMGLLERSWCSEYVKLVFKLNLFCLIF